MCSSSLNCLAPLNLYCVVKGLLVISFKGIIHCPLHRLWLLNISQSAEWPLIPILPPHTAVLCFPSKTNDCLCPTTGLLAWLKDYWIGVLGLNSSTGWHINVKTTAIYNCFCAVSLTQLVCLWQWWERLGFWHLRLWLRYSNYQSWFLDCYQDFRILV